MTFNEALEQAGDRIGAIPVVEKVEGLLESMSPRDRKLLGLLAGIFLIVGGGLSVYLIQGVLDDERGRITTLEGQLFQAENALLDTQELAERVASAEEGLQDDEDFIVQSFIDREANEAGFTTEQKASIQPRSTIPGDVYNQAVVEVQLKGVSLEDLGRFLYSLEYGERPVHVRELRVRTDRRDRQKLDSELELTVVSFAQES